MTRYLLGEMTWTEVRDAASAGRVLLQPVAAIEQHGPHLPVDTDNLTVVALCDAAASAHPDELVVAPVIPYGFNDHNMEFPGTVSIRPETLLAYYVDAGKSFVTMGFQRLLFVNGHGSNEPIVNLASRQINNETPAWSAATSPGRLVARVDRELKVRTSPRGGTAHACEFETSLYMHLRPELVRTELIVDEVPQGGPRYDDQDWQADSPIQFMDWWSQRSRSGVEGMPSHASPKKGKVLFEAAVALLVDIARDLRDIQLPERQDMRGPTAWKAGLVG